MTLPYHSSTVPVLDAPDVLEDQSWKKRAACNDADIDPNLFVFQDQHSIKEAKAICSTCPVQPECLEYALTVKKSQYGTWGGHSEEEVKDMRRKLKNRGLL